MNRSSLFPRFYSPLLLLVALAACTLRAAAQNILTAQMTSNTSTLKINAYHVATYAISFTCSSTTTDALNASVVVTLDPNMELVSTQRPQEVTSVNRVGNIVTFTFRPVLAAGTTGQLAVQARFLGTAPGGTVATTRATFAAANTSTVNLGPILVTGTDPVVASTATISFSRDAYIYKTAPSSINANSPHVTYYITHGNRGATGDNIANYAVEDRFPAYMALDYFEQERFKTPAPGLDVVVRYITNLTGTWRQWGNTALYNTATPNTRYASAVPLSQGEYITGLRWEYGTVPGGGFYHPDNQNRAIALRLKLMPGFGRTGLASFNASRPLGLAQDYNAFIFDDVSGLKDVDGALAVGGDLLVENPDVAKKLSSLWNGRDSLVVGGALTYTGGTLYYGNAVYAEELINNFQVASGTKRLGISSIDFNAARTYWREASASWATLPTTSGASTTRTGNTITINAANAPGLVTVRLGNSGMAGIKNLNIINFAPAATLLINVTGLDEIIFNSCEITINGTGGETPQQQRVLWNFPTLQFVDLRHKDLPGSVLAPRASVGMLGGNKIKGNTIALRLVSPDNNAKLGWLPFIGDDLPDPAVGTGFATSVTNCADVSGTGYANQSCRTSTVSPPAPNIQFWNALASSTRPGIGEAFLSYLHLCQYPDSTEAVFNPTIVTVVPREFEYVDFSMSGDGWTAAGSPLPSLEKLDNTPAAGQTLLRWKWGGDSPLHFLPNRNHSYVTVKLNLRVRTGVLNGSYQHRSYGFWDTPPNTGGSNSTQPDIEDFDADQITTERRAHDSDTVAVLTNQGNATLVSEMVVKGELDSSWLRYPANGLTVPGGRADYRLSITNTGGVAIRNLKIIDVLPSPGDFGVVDLAPRGSEWEPVLVSAVTAPPGVSVFYSTSRNPCRTEILGTPLPLGCETPAWSTATPADLSTVRSLKFEYTGADLMPSQTLTFGWPMRAPWSAPTAGEIAWNSFGYKAIRADNSVELLPAEPRKTGIAIRPPDPPYYGDRVWADTNANGIQDPGEPGLNGLRVELWRDDGDGVASLSKDTLVTFTLTTNFGIDGYYKFGNIGPGNYFAVIMAPPNMGVAPQDRGTDGTLDSDGMSIVYRSRRAAIMPVTNLTLLEEDMTWDQGFTDRSTIPAVWAVAVQSDGKSVLGGRFAASHGIARNNIARVNADGSCDTSFNPGTGFDGVVRSLALRSDGSIWCGGNFSNYNGQPSKGVALLEPDGTWISRTARTDTSEINWVGASGDKMYLAGRFSKCGNVTCGNIARLKEDGTVDTAWMGGVGADGEVLCGAVLPDGCVILGGSFDTVHGIDRKGVAKLKANGNLDSAFNPGTGTDGEVYSIKAFEDGRLLLTGTFRQYNGTPCNGAVRIKTDGSIDNASLSSLNVESINSSD